MANAEQTSKIMELLTNFPGSFRLWLLKELYDLDSAPRGTLTITHKLTRSELRMSIDYISLQGPFFNVSYHSGLINIPRHSGVSLVALISTLRMMSGYSIERDVPYTYFKQEQLDPDNIVNILYKKHISLSRLTNFQCASGMDLHDIVQYLMYKGNNTKEFLVVQAGIRASNAIECSRVLNTDRSKLNHYDLVLRKVLDREINPESVATSTALAIQTLRSNVPWYELFDQKDLDSE